MSEQTRAFEIGYGTDGGGYSFEEATLGQPFEPSERAVLAYDGDLDYLGMYPEAGTGDMALVDPQSRELPTGYVTTDGGLSLASSDTVLWYESDRECGCNGVKDEHEHGGWRFTGDFGDPTYPDCDRCGGPEDGDGYVTSPGCTMRTYETASDYLWHPVFHGLLVVAHAQAGHILDVAEEE